MINLPNIIKIRTWITLCMAFGATLTSCFGIVAIDDECNVDADCRFLGLNLQCKKHLCVTIEKQSQKDAGDDAATQTDINSDGNQETDHGTVAVTDTSVSSTVDTSVPSDIGTDTNTTPDTNTGPDPDTVTTTNAPTDTQNGTPTVSTEETDSETETAEQPTVYFSYPFTDDLEGFLGEGFTHDAVNGYAEVLHSFNGMNQSLDFRTALPPEHSDWSNATDINAIVRVDQYVSGGLQLFVKSGENWSWCAQWFDFVNLREWSTITMDLSTCINSGDMSFIRSIGIQIHSGSTFDGEQDVHVLVDELYVRHIVPPVETDIGGSDTSDNRATDTSDSTMDASVDASIDAGSK